MRECSSLLIKTIINKNLQNQNLVTEFFFISGTLDVEYMGYQMWMIGPNHGTHSYRLKTAEYYNLSIVSLQTCDK